VANSCKSSTFLYTYFTEFPAIVSRPIFFWFNILTILLVFVFHAAFAVEFPIQVVAVDDTAFLQNVPVSSHFIAMLINLRGMPGQNLTIAISIPRQNLLQVRFLG
jgi:hypothetical protein